MRRPFSRRWERNLIDQFEVNTANNAEAALDILSDSEPYAVVVSDMRMPGISGAELLAEVKRRSPDAVRILLTGHSDIDAAADPVNHGASFGFSANPALWAARPRRPLSGEQVLSSAPRCVHLIFTGTWSAVRHADRLS
jgi:DNA-binding NarL/FixJ family response regulator